MSDTALWDPAAPSQAVWWDPVVTLAAVLAQLRLSGGDIDEARIAKLIPAAGQLINEHLDLAVDPAPPIPVALQDALERVTIKMYNRTGDVDSVGVVIYDGADPLGEVVSQLAPYKSRWGCA